MFQIFKKRHHLLAVGLLAPLCVGMIPLTESTASAAVSTWSGNGDQTSFTDPANWDVLPSNDGTADLIFPVVGGTKRTVTVDANYSIRTLKIANNAGSGYDIKNANNAVLTIMGVGNNFTTALSTSGAGSPITQTINANLLVGSASGIQVDARDNPFTINGNVDLGGASNVFLAFAGPTSSQVLTLNGVLSNAPSNKAVVFGGSN